MQTVGRTESTALAEALRTALAHRQLDHETGDGSTPAGVLVPLRYHDGGWHLIVNLRSEHVGQHRGEVAFPGGRLEPHDGDMSACALRETWEEMGIRPGDVDILGPLTARLTRTDFLVWPIVGVVPYPYRFRPDPREVAEVIEIPLHDLLNESSVRYEARMEPDGSLLRRTAYSHNGYLVYGATAWILSELLETISGIT